MKLLFSNDWGNLAKKNIALNKKIDTSHREFEKIFIQVYSTDNSIKCIPFDKNCD